MPKHQAKKVNIACGNVFVTDHDWVNYDYSASGKVVHAADLLRGLPLPDNGAELVYSSHFFEHIPRSDVSSFLAECRRVLAPGGVLRLVLPDLENICRAYLTYRDRSENEYADFVVLEMIDQCVRREPGGELGRLYRTLKEDPTNQDDMIEFVRERTGDDLQQRPVARKFMSSTDMFYRMARRTRGRIERIWMRAVIKMLPSAFRAQNVSLAGVGERHHWLWDFHQLSETLKDVGFVDIERCDAASSRYSDFPFQPLDLDANGQPRKGVESMYIEAQKPV